MDADQQPPTSGQGRHTATLGTSDNSSRQVAEIVKLVRHRTVFDGDYAEARFPAFQRHGDRPAGHHFQIAIAPQFVVVVVAGEDVLHGARAETVVVRAEALAVLMLIFLGDAYRIPMMRPPA